MYMYVIYIYIYIYMYVTLYIYVCVVNTYILMPQCFEKFSSFLQISFFNFYKLDLFKQNLSLS